MEADALPRISKRNGEKSSGIVPQLFSSEAVRDQPTPTNQAAAFTSKYRITIPKSARYRGGKGTSGDMSQTRGPVGLFTMKQVPKEQQQQRSLSTRALPRKPLFSTGLDTQPSHPATTLSSPKTFAEWGDDYMQQPQQVEAANPSRSQLFSTTRKALDATRDFQNSSMTEMENVRSENETLRLEIANLKGKLVEKRAVSRQFVSCRKVSSVSTIRSNKFFLQLMLFYEADAEEISQ
uniref:Uncharacterized protein n=1 Tax=Globisporangium ultimum (strain ATCC 200006 / CBS 805.95 / DAOM BR144) TaxID=431595 RepID=K3WLZ5_GLOUD